MAEDFVRLRHAFFLPAGGHHVESGWQPAADVYRTRRGWRVKFDLAGVRPEDIVLTTAGSRLTVQGTRRDCATEEGCDYYRMEIAYSHFQRSIDLPCRLDAARLSMEYRDGMLVVSIETEADK